MLDPEGHKKKTASNRCQSASVLVARGIEHTSHNKGAHLVVQETIDYWPGTGLFIDRVTGRRGRGVFNLVKMIQRQE